MDWKVLLIGVAILAVLYTLKAGPGISEEAAREHLKSGAIVVDVRSAEEFKETHLPNAVNIPLGELKEVLPRRVPDRSKVVLLHCQSGRRSGMAERELRSLGYTNAFNIGSLDRAQKIVSGKAK